MTRAHRASRRNGFALVTVIWGVGLIATLVVTFMTTGRLRLQTAQNIANAVTASYVAEAAINLTVLELLARQNANETRAVSAVEEGLPRFCMFDRVAVAVAVEDEGGKIDLNAAPIETLRALLLGVGLSENMAAEISRSIVAFRTAQPPPGQGADASPAPAQSDKAVSLKQAPFATVTELDQVGGIDPALYRLLLHFVTVASRSPGLDPRTAPPGLFAALAGYPVEDVRRLAVAPFPNRINRNDARFPANLGQMSGGTAFLIHVEALLASGQTVARDALIELRPANGKPFVFREFRRGEAVYFDQLRAMNTAHGAGATAC